MWEEIIMDKISTYTSKQELPGKNVKYNNCILRRRAMVAITVRRTFDTRGSEAKELHRSANSNISR